MKVGVPCSQPKCCEMLLEPFCVHESCWLPGVPDVEMGDSEAPTAAGHMEFKTPVVAGGVLDVSPVKGSCGRTNVAGTWCTPTRP